MFHGVGDIDRMCRIYRWKALDIEMGDIGYIDGKRWIYRCVIQSY